MPILKLEEDNPKKELEFEVKCSLEMKPEERLQQWLEWNIEMLAWIESMRKSKDEDQNPPKILKRI